MAHCKLSSGESEQPGKVANKQIQRKLEAGKSS